MNTALLLALIVGIIVSGWLGQIAQHIHKSKAWEQDEPHALIAGIGFAVLYAFSLLVWLACAIALVIRLNEGVS